MNNEFGDDLGVVDKEKQKRDKERNGRLRRENSAFVAGVRSKDNGKADGDPVTRSSQMCSGQHGIWQCEQFKQLSVSERKKRAADKALCFKCLGTGHYVKYAQRSISGAKYLVAERSIIHCYMLPRRRARKRSRQQVRTTLKAKWSQPLGRESLECV